MVQSRFIQCGDASRDDIPRLLTTSMTVPMRSCHLFILVAAGNVSGKLVVVVEFFLDLNRLIVAVLSYMRDMSDRFCRCVLP